MPIPRNWDSVGMRAVRVVEISPPPTELYQEVNGTQIAHWSLGGRDSRVFKVVFEVELSSVSQQITDIDFIPPYDTGSGLYIRNTAPTLAAQSDNPKLIDLAWQIVESETNPYRQARLLHQWVSNLGLQGESTTANHDALSTYHTRSGDCANRANLFVALCRAIGIPARNVAGIDSSGMRVITSGNKQDGTLGTHVWAEFYIPRVGWIQCDPSNPGAFARIDAHRIVLSRGNDIETGHDECKGGQTSFFHTPETSEWCGGVGPAPLYLKVEKID